MQCSMHESNKALQLPSENSQSTVNKYSDLTAGGTFKRIVVRLAFLMVTDNLVL